MNYRDLAEVVPIPNRFAITAAIAEDQAKRIKRCRSAACFQEILSTFKSWAYKLEKVVDEASGKDKDNEFSMFSGKYERYISFSKSRPVTRLSRGTIKDLEDKDKSGKINVRRWDRHALFDLLQEPPISSDAVHQILAQAPPWARRMIFIDEWLSEQTTPAALARFPLERDVVLEIRNRRTVEAFVVLLALAREAEHASHQQEHALYAACAREIFPYIVKDCPQLRARWLDLYECLKTSFWSRIYLADGLHYPIKRFEALEGIVAVLRDPLHPKLPFSMGVTSTEAKRRQARTKG